MRRHPEGFPPSANPQEGDTRMTSRDKLTFDEHQAIAAELFEIRNRLVELTVRLGRGVTCRTATRACAWTDRLRCQLDDQLARDFPGEFDTHVYYPGRPRPSTTTVEQASCRWDAGWRGTPPA
jgi:hypothetical protein